MVCVEVSLPDLHRSWAALSAQASEEARALQCAPLWRRTSSLNCVVVPCCTGTRLTPWPSGGGSQAATPTQQAGSAEQQQQPEEGPQQAWQHMKADMQDPHDWDRHTEQEYERAAQRRALHT